MKEKDSSLKQAKLTTSDKITSKKSPGRPPGKRNKVSVKETLQGVLRQGKDLTQLKEVCDYYIENAEEEGLTPKQVLDFLRTDIDLYKWATEQIQKVEKDNKPESPKQTAPDSENPQEGGVVPFRLGGSK